MSKNFAQKHVTIGLVNESLSGLVELNNLHGSHPGYAVEVTKMVCELLGYQCKFKISSTNEYGLKDANGTWSGLLRELKNGTYNASIPLFTPTTQRFNDFSFSEMGTYQHSNFYTRESTFHTVGKYSDIFKPLDHHIWMYIMLSIVLISATICIAQSTLKLKGTEVRYTSIIDTLLIILLFLVRKGRKIEQSRLSTKTILTIWGFISIVLIASFSSGLLSAMVKTADSYLFKDLQTLSECIDKGTCQMIIAPAGDQFLSEVQMATESSQYFSLKMALRKRPVIKVSKAAEAVEKILRTTDKFLVTWPTLRKLSCLNGTDQKLAFVDFGAQISLFPFRKGDPMKFEFDKKMKQLYSSGLIHHLGQKYKNNEKSCERQSPGKAPLRTHTLNLRSFYSLFIFLSGGLVVSSLTVAFEFVGKKHKSLLRQGKLKINPD